MIEPKMRLSSIVLSPKTLGRLRQVVVIAGKYGFGELVDKLPLPFRKPPCEECAEAKELTVWAKVRKLLEDLGPTTVKIGQVISMRPDMAPIALCDELKKLQEDAPREEFHSVMATLRHAYAGGEWPFEAVDQEPIASASLSQVHRAIRADGGEVYAVKVQRRAIRELIEADLAIFRYLAEFLDERVAELKTARLPDLVREIRKTLERELDFTNEARNMLLFNRYFADQELLSAPGVEWSLTRPDVLVMEYLPGVRLDEFEGTDADRKRLATAGMEGAVQQMLVYGFFHADPHLGNLKVCNNKLCYYDWGMVGRLTPAMRSALVDYILALVKNDPELVAQVALDMSVLVPPGLDKQRFVADVMFVLERIHAVPGREVNLGRFMLDLTALCRDYGVHLRSDYILMGRALIATEAAGRTLYPDFDALEALRPVAADYIKKRRSPFLSDRPFWRDIKRNVEAMIAIPGRAERVLDMMEQGEVRIHLVQDEQAKQLQSLRHSAYIISVGLITASLVIGSALVFTSNIGPHYAGLPLYGLAGFTLSGCLAAWVLWKLLRQ